jgi:hypothetical protein
VRTCGCQRCERTLLEGADVAGGGAFILEPVTCAASALLGGGTYWGFLAPPHDILYEGLRIDLSLWGNKTAPLG